MAYLCPSLTAARQMILEGEIVFRDKPSTSLLMQKSRLRVKHPYIAFIYAQAIHMACRLCPQL